MRPRAGRGEARAFIEAAAVTDVDTCIVWPFSVNAKGYGDVWFRGRKVNAHRAVLMLVTGVDPPEMEAAHGPCHNPPCINPRHLSWKSRLDNDRDKQRDGTARRGEQHARSKLTDAEVAEIRRRRAEGALQREIAAEFGVSAGHVGHVLRGRYR